MTNKNKKFLGMGILALASVYGLQAVGIPIYNEFSNSAHEMKMISLYNKIWPQIDKKDVSKEIKEYKELANESPVNYKFGVLPEKIRVFFNNKELPSASNIEESAKSLNRKTRLF